MQAAFAAVCTYPREGYASMKLPCGLITLCEKNPAVFAQRVIIRVWDADPHVVAYGALNLWLGRAKSPFSCCYWASQIDTTLPLKYEERFYINSHSKRSSYLLIGMELYDIFQACNSWGLFVCSSNIHAVYTPVTTNHAITFAFRVAFVAWSCVALRFFQRMCS